MVRITANNQAAQGMEQPSGTRAPANNTSAHRRAPVEGGLDLNALEGLEGTSRITAGRTPGDEVEGTRPISSGQELEQAE